MGKGGPAEEVEKAYRAGTRAMARGDSGPPNKWKGEWASMRDHRETKGRLATPTPRKGRE